MSRRNPEYDRHNDEDPPNEEEEGNVEEAQEEGDTQPTAPDKGPLIMTRRGFIWGVLALVAAGVIATSNVGKHCGGAPEPAPKVEKAPLPEGSLKFEVLDIPAQTAQEMARCEAEVNRLGTLIARTPPEQAVQRKKLKEEYSKAEAEMYTVYRSLAPALQDYVTKINKPIKVKTGEKGELLADEVEGVITAHKMAASIWATIPLPPAFREYILAESWKESKDPQNPYGRYHALGPEIKKPGMHIGTHALSRYQIMPVRWIEWSKKYLGKVVKPTPQAIEYIAFYEFASMYARVSKIYKNEYSRYFAMAGAWYAPEKSWTAEDVEYEDQYKIKHKIIVPVFPKNSPADVVEVIDYAKSVTGRMLVTSATPEAREAEGVRANAQDINFFDKAKNKVRKAERWCEGQSLCPEVHNWGWRWPPWGKKKGKGKGK